MQKHYFYFLRKPCSKVYSLRYGSSFLKAAKTILAIALSCGWLVSADPEICNVTDQNLIGIHSIVMGFKVLPV